jgi:hypothetical protein
MSNLTEFLYPVPAKRSVGGIIKWWEKRRLAYNVVVGASGLLSIGSMIVLSALPPGGMMPPGFLAILQPIVAVGLLANLCYLLGPTVETIVEKIWGDQVMPVGPVLYRMGLTFSVGLMFLPTLIMTIVWVARVLGFLF